MELTRADEVAGFYKGKDITLVISASSGGGYDVLSRSIARHISKHIPSNPNVVPRNMPGAGGIIASRYMFTSAPRDGTVIGSVQNNAPLEPLFGTKEADYDATKFNWLGSPSVETALLFVWHTSSFKSFEDAQKRQMTAGASGVNSAPAFYARVLNEVFGTRMRIIAGYPAQNEANLAIERGELDTYGVTFWSSLTSSRPDWIRERKIRILLQYGPTKEPALEGVPYGPDLIKADSDRLFFEAAYGPLTLGRPYLIPPLVPVDRVSALRKAFMETMKDEAFVAEAAKLGLNIDSPKSGEELQAEVQHLYSMPKEIQERLRRVAQGK